MIEYQQFKMPTITTVLQMIRRDDKFVSLDLQDTFACVKMSKTDFSYLQFSFENKHYMYTVLPNGIAIGPRVFVSLTKVITAHLRKLGIDIVIYIDDTLIINPCIMELQKHAGIAREVFERCGFIVNDGKSQLVPSTTTVFLGFVIDSKWFTVSLTDNKNSALRKLVAKTLQLKTVTIRHLAKVIGCIVAIFLASEVGPLHYRTLETRESTPAEIAWLLE